MDDIFEAVKKKTIVVGVENIADRIFKPCEVCHQQFTLAELIPHKRVHKERLPYKKPKVDTKGSTILNGPWRNPIYTCPVCPDIFTKETELRIHQIQKHSLSLVACLKETEIPETLRVVGDISGEADKNSTSNQSKRYKCRYCDKVFRLSSQCKSHENAHDAHPDPSNASVITTKFNDVPLHLESSSDLLPLPSELDSSQSEAYVETRGLDVPASQSTGDTPKPLPTSDFDSETDLGSQHNAKTDCHEMDQHQQVESITTSTSQLEYNGMEMSSAVIPPPFPFEFQQSNEFPFRNNVDGTIGTPQLLGNVSVKQEPEEPCNTLSLESTPLIPNGDVVPAKCDEKRYKCLVCGEEFPELEIFPHAKTHLRRGQKECDHCVYRANTTGDLRDHISKHYQVKPYRCPYCPNVYGWQSGLKKHLVTHSTGDKSFKCKMCPMTFSAQRECRRHELIHEDIRAPLSNSKKKPKRKKEKAIKVIKIEAPDFDASGTRSTTEDPRFPNVQQYSDTRFTHQAQSYYDVNSSSSSMSMDSLYNNTNSSVVYTQQPQSQLSQPQPEMTNRNNSWPGTQQSNYYGDYTNEFSSHQQQQPQQQLVQHHNNWSSSTDEQQQIGAYHSNHNFDNHGEQDQSGKMEQHAFREPGDLRESETCKTCGIEISMRELPTHIRSHILPGQKGCSLCKYKCNSRVNLEEHYNIHYGLKPYLCNLCNSRFSLRSYLRTHTQQEHQSSEGYQCRYCNKRFVRSCHLKTHEMIHEGQGEVLPQRESSYGNSGHDSDSNSNSNASFRTPMTPDRSCSSTATSSPSNYGIYSRSNTDSPQSVASSTVSTLTAKGESHWSGPTSEHPDQGHMATTTPWPQYFNTPQQGHDQGHSNVMYSPLVKSDVNWPQPLYDSTAWQHQSSTQTTNPVYPLTPQKIDTSWSESFNGFNTGNTPGSGTPSASVQDLWAELHFEEMKWFPESSTGFTADGIPMITELGPLDGFSYTEMLHNATADLPNFGSTFNQYSKSNVVASGSAEIVQNTAESEQCFQQVEAKIEKKSGKGERERRENQTPQLNRSSYNARGNGTAAKSSKRRHLSAKSFKRIPNGEIDTDESISASPKMDISAGEDGETDDDQDALKKCLTCHVKIPRKDLLDHLRSHISPGQRTCDICQRTYCNPLTLKEHIHIHYKLKPYKCAFCDAKFSTKYSRKTHEVFNHEQCKSSIVVCPLPACGKFFAIRSELAKHLRAHAKKNGTPVIQLSSPAVPPKNLNGTKNLSASKNSRRGRKSSGNSNKTKRNENSTGTAQVQHSTSKSVNEVASAASTFKMEQFKDVLSRTWEVRLKDIGQTMKKECPLCKKEILLADFLDHKKNHMEVCHHCRKPVPVTAVVAHGQSHVGDEIVCEICGTQCKQRSTLWEHMNVHLKLKPIRCVYCGQGFASRTSLRCHFLALHTKFRPHSCRFCGKSFVQHTTMLAHELIHLGTQCPSCSKSFTTRKEVQNHLREEHSTDS